ncbi:MAG: hypothetical protein CSA96_01475 [Bacteroidetes bacterium]|nr:MAG: hypothetical protein CSA96_01475 [Bacteroidota bacterium]
MHIHAAAQDLSNAENGSVIKNKTQFNGYTNHWQNNYTQWYRYGNLFKMAVPEVPPAILQSKVDIADDLGLPGLFLEEGFLSHLYTCSYRILENPEPAALEKALESGNILVITHPDSRIGRILKAEAKGVFSWKDELKSYQFGAAAYEELEAFRLTNKANTLFVISSKSRNRAEQLLQQIADTKALLEQYELYKGWFGASSLLKSVTCTQGHPLELIGKGMNEGNSWFIFDGYMDFLAKDEIEDWVKEVDLPIVANVGFSPIYGCADYEGLQVQDMATKQSWIDYAHKKGGYAFRRVYDRDCDDFEFDGYIVHEGNKEQIDHENVPFINKTGQLAGNLTSSMVLFIEKGEGLSNESIWDAIMNRREVAILEQAKMMGPAKFRNALQLLYLDKDYLENYFGDRLDVESKFEGYNLLLRLKNYETKKIRGTVSIRPGTGLKVKPGFTGTFELDAGEVQQISVPMEVGPAAMGRTNPVALHFSWGNATKSSLAMLDLPPAISVHQLLYAHEPTVNYPVTIHNFSENNAFPVELKVFKKTNLRKPVFSQTLNCETAKASYKELQFELALPAGEYLVKTSALGLDYESQLGVGKAEGKPYVYEVDLNSDGINEYRMENDSVQVTLLRTGARVIEYIVKSKDDNVLFKIWPEKAESHKRPFRRRNFYPFGGFEDFLGQASMETHQIYDARITHKEGDFVQVEMETDYYGNSLKKIFTLYGNSPLLEVRFTLDFKNPEANVLGPQPILHLGEEHGTEDVFTVPTMEEGLKEYRMRPEKYYGQAINVKEGWNAGYDTEEDIAFVGAFPVSQPLFLHMWMNHPVNKDAPHYYTEFQPWTPIVQKSKMYFTYYLWGSGGAWQNGVDELRKRNLISTR